MKVILTLSVFSAFFLAATYVGVAEDKEICSSGICVVEFNASFNAQNSVQWM